MPRPWLYATALSLCILLLLEFCLHQRWRAQHSSMALEHPGYCRPDAEGQWAIGLYKGSSPLNLAPIEQWQPRADTNLAWPVANPVLTCSHLLDHSSGFVADPFLWPSQGLGEDPWYMFYETKTQRDSQGDIGAAVSLDQGLSWQHQGVVLDEPWHLSYPFVFQHDDTMFMIPEGSAGGALRLYTTDIMPIRWRLHKVLINEPLIDASLLAPLSQGIAKSDGRWYLLASNHKAKTCSKCRELEIWHAADLLGPWEPHPKNPVRSGVQKSRMAGRPVVDDGRLLRFAQNCGPMYGHRLHAFHITTLNATHFEEEEVPLKFNPSGGATSSNVWNNVRWHHCDAHKLPSGEWVAAMDGDRYVSGYQLRAWETRLLTVTMPASLVMGGALMWIISAGGVVLAWQELVKSAPVLFIAYLFCNFCCCCCINLRRSALLPDKLMERLMPTSTFVPMSLNVHESTDLDEAQLAQSTRRNTSPTRSSDIRRSTPVLRSTGTPGTPQPVTPDAQGVGTRGRTKGSSSTVLQQLPAKFDTFLKLPRPWLIGFTLWQLLAALVVSALCLRLSALLLWELGRPQLLRFIMWYVREFGGNPAPIPIEGQLSKFTVVVMSYEVRLLTLTAFVAHYSQCASVSEIVVVWNKGEPPDLARQLPSQVPIRIRVEDQNSMNNRFQIDPLIQTRAVLMLDDDIIMPCHDIERGFARWRLHPKRVTGFYARLLEGDVPQYRCTHCEGHTYASGQYNVILAGASFLDAESVFPAYSSPANKLGREYVDRVFNCDDLLLNYLMADRAEGAQHVEWVRPTMRFDVGRLTSKRLSSGNFGPVRHNCTRDFAGMFGNPLKGKKYSLNFEGKGAPWCPTGIGCIFL